MIETMNKPIRWMPFLFLSFLVIGSNVVLYQTNYFQPIPTSVLIGSMFDFLLVIPLLTYYFIIRKRYSWKLTLLVALVSYAFASWIIPDDLMKSVSYIPKALLLLEAGFISIELYLLFIVFRKFPKVKKTYSELDDEIPFLLRIKQAINVHFTRSRLIDSLISEITMFYYALFSWRKAPMVNEQTFTYHKNTSYVALQLMLIHALIIESVGLHYFFSQWNHTVSLILLFINIYSILFLIGQMQVVKKVPLIVTERSLILNIGFIKSLDLPFKYIQEWKTYEGPDELSAAERKYTFEARVSDFIAEKPNIELLLKKPVRSEIIYGFKKNVTRVVIKVDHPAELMRLIEKRMAEDACNLED
ncbi:hypothetical protein ABE65_003365 [Fictibacillus phosphorivorans]|uniref:Beta-carotene 15,15'-monooxygenase n=1 Tax=Fictibacillus phosphorivorans TaxID=1221500 RepID=A0A160IIZ3_9BACL|nr:hypothetical protein [Fictibacillus phosphorivorans]ANC75904.1 hypothetical protein ABE65_003365 [Fictibacillus phosphorivorans]